MRSARASLLANSDTHHLRAAAPQCVSSPPPIELATITFTHPLRDDGALGRANVQTATPSKATKTTAMISFWPRVSG
jgi:hypothetical protein